MIELDRVSFGYRQHERLLRNLTLTLRPGNIYGLLGLNGAGKSTLLKLVTGLLYPGHGSIRTLGYDASRRSPGMLEKIFVLPEELNVPRVTVGEYVRTRAPFYSGFAHDRFERYLTEFELPRDRKLTELSYGQKKKLLLSFGLACNSALLVMDEPTNGLDIPSKGQFRRLIAEAATEDRVFIVSTHQVRDVESLIDPIVVLHGGAVVLNQTIAELGSRIRMSHTPTRPEACANGLLHTEPAIGGFWSVWSGGGDGRLDLEVLFNTIVTRSAGAAPLFTAEGVAA
jgi:ABC-2 type transport system ATP-binding protein